MLLKEKGGNNMGIATKCVHGEGEHNNPTGSLSVPIYQSASFAHPGVGQSTGYDYSRLQNPTREAVENVVASIEGGVDAIAFSTGMAALTTLMEQFAPGDHIIASLDLYGGSHRLFRTISKKNGITFSFLDTACIENVKAQITPNTKAFFIETPTNPTMMISNIAAIVELAKSINALVIVDNTFLTPIFQRPIDLGVDVVLHSGTKYLSGHNDTLAGFLVFAHNTLAESVRFTAKTIGACLSPFDSWLVIRGIKTLSLRMKSASQNAETIASWLKTVPGVEQVYYVGLKEHPGHEIQLKQSTGFGAMISFRVESEELAHQVLGKVRLIQFAESLGGVESLITYPITQTHADVPEEQRIALGIDNRLLRLSVGIEDVEDLIDDLGQALTSK